MITKIIRPALRFSGNTAWTLSTFMPHNKWHFEGYDRVYLHHVRKTAGTSISFAFMRLSGVDPGVIERRLARYTFTQVNGYRYVGNGNLALMRRGDYFFSFSHEPEYSVQLPANTFRFTVLRDPISRVVSLYRYLASPSTDLAFHLKAPLAERRWAMKGFDGFLDQVPLPHLTNQLYMFSQSGSIDEAVDRLSKLDMVLRTESLDHDLCRLERALDLQLPLTKERTSLLPFAPTAQQEDRLQDLLADEYEVLRQIGSTS
jgi:hypothetical protein